jgi:AraC-like DNA-binding protein
LPDNPLNGGILKWNGGGECVCVGGMFAFSGIHSHCLLEGLPPVIYIRSESEKAELRWYLERMMRELREQRPGASLIAQQLATAIVLQALRLHLENGTTFKPGCLFALVDKNLRATMSAIHNDPAHGWSLQELAERSGMSRSSFALKFKKSVQMSPIEYLTRWRMLLARHKLTSSDESISEIALSLGYESESAFRTAFRKVMACSPRQYRSGKHLDYRSG